MKSIFSLEKGMTQAISHFSRFDDASYKRSAGKYEYTGNECKTAEAKIRSFYNGTSAFLVVAALALLILTNVRAASAPPTDEQSSTDPAITAPNSDGG